MVRRGRLLAWLGVFLISTAWGWSQTRVLVDYEDEVLPVVAMDGPTPLVELNGERMPVPEARVRVVPAEAYTDGTIEIIDRSGMMGQDYGSVVGGFFFRFEAVVEAERDFEDCFVLFVIAPESGEDTYLIREISDIDAVGSERIVVTLPVNPGFGGGRFAYMLFSRGEEIRRYEPDEPIALTGLGDNLSESGGRGEVSRSAGEGTPARVVKQRLLEFPEALVGRVTGGYASAIFSIDEKGRAYELIEVRADQPEFVSEIWHTIVGTEYEPGTYQGEALVTTVQQTFFFNEFAPFAEGMEMVPYPEVGDRDAVAIYAPLPEASVFKPIDVRLEVRVGLLGRVKQSRVLQGADTAAGKLAEQAVEDWIFLPAIVDGFPAEQVLEIPIAFGASE